MTSRFKPFKVLMKLEVPVAIGEFGLSLDSILLYCIGADLGSLNSPATLLDGILKKHDSGVYHASQSVFISKAYEEGDEELKRLVPRQIPRISMMRTETNLSDTLVRPTGKSGKYSKVQLTGGAYSDRLKKVKAYWSEYVGFYGVGDIEEIQTLLNLYISAIGVDRTGRVSSIRVIEIEEDLSLFGSGTLMRSMPVQHCNNIQFQTTSLMSLVPPYYQQYCQISECALPARIRHIYQNINDLI